MRFIFFRRDDICASTALYITSLSRGQIFEMIASFVNTCPGLLMKRWIRSNSLEVNWTDLPSHCSSTVDSLSEMLEKAMILVLRA